MVILKIEGMHCHKCEQTIRRAVTELPGVHEVEIDFPSGQASILYGRATTAAAVAAQVTAAGYRVTSVTQR